MSNWDRVNPEQESFGHPVAKFREEPLFQVSEVSYSNATTTRLTILQSENKLYMLEISVMKKKIEQLEKLLKNNRPAPPYLTGPDSQYEQLVSDNRRLTSILKNYQLELTQARKLNKDVQFELKRLMSNFEELQKQNKRLRQDSVSRDYALWRSNYKPDDTRDRQPRKAQSPKSREQTSSKIANNPYYKFMEINRKQKDPNRYHRLSPTR